MTKVILGPEVSKAFPEAEIRFIFASDLVGSSPWLEAADIRIESEESIANDRGDAFDAESGYIVSWQASYRLVTRDRHSAVRKS